MSFILLKYSDDTYRLVANRQMTVFPTAMSLLASFMSGITILGNPAESYNYGTLFVWAGIAHIMVAIVVANVFIPVCSQNKLLIMFTN